MKKNDVLVQAVFTAGLVAAIAAGGRVGLVRAQEAAPPLPPAAKGWQLVTFDMHEQQVIERTIQSLMSELGPGFTINVTKTVPTPCESAACGKTACEDMIARIGSSECAGACNANCSEKPAKFVGLGCPCTEAGECVCATEAAGGSEGGACKCCPCANQTACDEATCGEEHATSLAAHHVGEELKAKGHEHCPIMEHLPRLIAEQAAAKAELASRKEASEKFSELYETLTELVATNAALHAKLEAQEEHVQLIHKLSELAVENARLKAHVELAGAHAGAGQHALTLSIENERLKQRLADLEQKYAAGEETRSAARSSSDKLSR